MLGPVNVILFCVVFLQFANLKTPPVLCSLQSGYFLVDQFKLDRLTKWFFRNISNPMMNSLIKSVIYAIVMLNINTVFCASVHPGFGYELLMGKLEAIEDRVSNIDKASNTISTDVTKLLKLVKSMPGAQKVYDSCDSVHTKVSGVYNIRINPRETVEMRCDMEYESGGWTVIQDRFDGSVNFYRDWNEYKRGFGKINGGEFWLGLDLIHQLTISGPHEMVVLLEDFEGNSTYAKLDRFEVAGEQEAYKVTLIEGLSGSAGDSIMGIRGRKFSTLDRDNDTWPNNCASHFHGAWWYADCHSSHLNGKYLKGHTSEYATGMIWATFRGFNYALKSSKIMIRKKK